MSRLNEQGNDIKNIDARLDKQDEFNRKQEKFNREVSQRLTKLESR
jgi:tetrahydromethanopterin S-methyltransferase subunit G